MIAAFGGEARSDRECLGAVIRSSGVYQQIQTRFRSDLVVTRAGQFTFDGYVDSGATPPPRLDERSISLAAGQRFPRMGLRTCWWSPASNAVIERVAARRGSWKGRSAAAGSAEQA